MKGNKFRDDESYERGAEKMRGRPQVAPVVAKGPQNKRSKRCYKTREREGGGTVDFRKAHYRIGHFHTFRTGKGRKEKIIKWVAPTYVRATKLDE